MTEKTTGYSGSRPISFSTVSVTSAVALEAGLGRLEAQRPDDQVVGQQLLHLLVGAGLELRVGKLPGDVRRRRGRDG
jgi:hypothetical protein